MSHRSFYRLYLIYIVISATDGQDHDIQTKKPTVHNTTVQSEQHLGIKVEIENTKYYPRTNTRLCGKKVIGSDEQCCRDKNGITAVHKIQNNMKCCQRDYYNTSTHYCYKNKLPLPWHRRKCGDIIYDDRLNKCCRKTLYDNVNEWDPNIRCCSSKIFDSTKQRCCQPQNHIIPKDKHCCHGKQYDLQKERCCTDGPVTFQKMSERCCGAKLYDTDIKGCCGTKTFNPLTEICCQPGGEIVPVKSEGMKCCGPISYNSSTELCCYPNQGKIIVKRKKNHDRCCTDYSTDNIKTYSILTHSCESGQLQSKYHLSHRFRHQKRSRKKRKKNGGEGCTILKRSVNSLKSMDICTRKTALLVKVQRRGRNRGEFLVSIQEDLHRSSSNTNRRLKLTLPSGCVVRRSRLVLLTSRLDQHIYLTKKDIIIPWNEYRKNINYIESLQKSCIQR